jgi:hypothetical protein
LSAEQLVVDGSDLIEAAGQSTFVVGSTDARDDPAESTGGDVSPPVSERPGGFLVCRKDIYLDCPAQLGDREIETDRTVTEVERMLPDETEDAATGQTLADDNLSMGLGWTAGDSRADCFQEATDPRSTVHKLGADQQHVDLVQVVVVHGLLDDRSQCVIRDEASQVHRRSAWAHQTNSVLSSVYIGQSHCVRVEGDDPGLGRDRMSVAGGRDVDPSVCREEAKVVQPSSSRAPNHGLGVGQTDLGAPHQLGHRSTRRSVRASDVLCKRPVRSKRLDLATSETRGLELLERGNPMLLGKEPMGIHRKVRHVVSLNHVMCSGGSR